MDKEKFLEWLDEKIVEIKYNTPEEHFDNEVKVQFWRGFVLSMQEIQSQVESGKFD